MIVRLQHAREWASRLFVSLVIIAAVVKDHVFEALGKPSGDAASEASAAATEKAAVTALSLPSPLIPIAYILALILLYALLETLVDVAIDGSRTVRRLLMGDEDIEGYWLDVVFQSDGVVSGGVVNIYYEDGLYKIEGRDFDETGVWRGWFATELSLYDSRYLSFKYRSIRPGATEDGTGHGQYNFTSGGAHRLTHFFGYFFEDRNARRFYLYGERLSDFVGPSADIKQAMKSTAIPPLVARFIDERRSALPVVPEAVDQPNPVSSSA
jgi:hypothetical protein